MKSGRCDSGLRTCARIAAVAAFCLTAINVLLISILGGYDIRVGALHPVANDLFKPLLFLNGAFFAVLAVRAGKPGANPAPAPGHGVISPGFLLASAAITAALYAISFRINLEFPDWTHRVTTNGRDMASFFWQRQYDLASGFSCHSRNPCGTACWRRPAN